MGAVWAARSQPSDSDGGAVEARAAPETPMGGSGRAQLGLSENPTSKWHMEHENSRPMLKTEAVFQLEMPW